MRLQMPALPVVRSGAMPASGRVRSRSTCPASVRVILKLSTAGRVASAKGVSAAGILLDCGRGRVPQQHTGEDDKDTGSEYDRFGGVGIAMAMQSKSPARFDPMVDPGSQPHCHQLVGKRIQ